MSEDAKRAAAWEAVKQVRSGMALGLGGGTTAALAVERIGELLRQGHLHDVAGVPCSEVVGDLARRSGVPLTDLAEHPLLDLTIDGADEVDPALNLIKGGGGALAREKVVAQASRRVVIVVDESKLSGSLGTRGPLPVDVIPFGWTSQAAYIEDMGGEPRLRRGDDGVPFVTDDGHYVIDCWFGPLPDPRLVAEELSVRAGVVEHGLFLGVADEVIVGGRDGVSHRRR